MAPERRFLRRFSISTVRARVRQDLDDELAAHFEEAIDGLVERGWSPSEARAEARRRFGDVKHYRKQIERLDRGRVRMRRSVDWIEAGLGSLKMALRSVRRAPGFSAAVVLTLALGIGVNVTMFEVVDRLLLSPPEGIEHPDEVRHVYVRRQARGSMLTTRTLTYADYEALQATEGFASVAAYSPARSMTLGDGEDAARISVSLVAAELFPTLGVHPLRGRFFTSEEDEVGAAPVAVLSAELWERQYGGDPSVLGRVLHVGDGNYEVIGIAPRRFTGSELIATDVWLPLETAQAIEVGHDQWKASKRWWWLRVVGRLNPGVADPAVAAEATSFHRAVRPDAEATGYDEQAEVLVSSLIAARGPDPSQESKVSIWLAGVSLLVLVIACANVANLFLGRAVRQRRELAVRTALGVSRRRLVGQLLVESLVLALLGAGAALAMMSWGRQIVQEVLMENLATLTFPPGRIFLFTGLLTVIASLTAGLIPAVQAGRADFRPALSQDVQSGSGRGRPRLRGGLVVLQAALSVVLLVGAGLFVRSLHAAGTIDLGFEPRSLLQVRLVRTEDNERSLTELYGEIETRIAALPGVEGTSTTASVPFWSALSLSVMVPGFDSLPARPTGGPMVNSGGADYFEVMGARITAGRAFRPSDVGEGVESVAVVNETFAETVWPGEDPLTKCVQVGSDKAPCSRIVGVVADYAVTDLREEPTMQVIVPLGHPHMRGVGSLLVRTSSDPAEAVAMIRSEVGGAVRGVRYVDVNPVWDLVARKLRAWQLGATLFTLFGALALAVSALGLYSVLAFDVAQRRREIGVRRALGAQAQTVMTRVVGSGVRLAAGGLLVGLTGAVGAAHFLEPLLFETSPHDGLTFGAVLVTLLLAAVVAAFVPAWRATRIDPAEAIRTE